MAIVHEAEPAGGTGGTGGAGGDERGPRAHDPLADWLTTSEVADLAGIGRGSVRRYVWRDSMPRPVRKGNILLWRRSDIEAWVRTRRPAGRPRKAV